MNSARTSNGFGVNCLSYTEIKAYYDLQQEQPEPWEVVVLRYFDNVVMKVYADKQKQEQHKSKK